MSDSGLTNKQKVFVDEYLVDFNATRAYKKAYPNIKNDETAATNGNRLLRNAKVKAYLDKRMHDREVRTEITQDRVLKELAAIAFANGSDFAEVLEEPLMANGVPVLDSEGNPVTYKTIKVYNTKDIPQEKRKAISGIKLTKNGIAVESADKVRALELLGKHLNMFTDKVEITDKQEKQIVNIEDMLEQVKEDNEK